jgi:hypothetical protein
MKAPTSFLLGATLFSAWLWAGEVLAYTDFGKGRPITAADLSGKKFCWSDGGWSIYAANGQFSNSLGKHSHWSVPEPGVLHAGRFLQMEVLPDGRLHWYFQVYSQDFDGWGTLCN